MTVEKFNELMKKDAAQREKMSGEISSLMEREAQLNKEMTAAADAGDVETFLSKKREKEQVTDAIFVMRTFMDKRKAAVTADDAREAWADYAADHNSKLKKALEAYNSEKAKLCQMYSDAIEMQREACAVRERLSAAVGLPESSFAMETIPCISGVNAFGLLKLSGFASMDPDACFYLSTYAAKNKVNLAMGLVAGNSIDPELKRVTNVVLSKKSSNSYCN